MKDWKLRLAKWLLKNDGFTFIAVKEENGNVWIEGDTQFIRYFDIHEYMAKSHNGKK